MSCQGMDGHLNEYVDGVLGETERALLERHLQTCAECRRELEALRRLLAAAASLPGSLPPARDLWEGVERAIGPAATPGRRVRAVPGPARGWWMRPGAALAAAALLIVCSAVVTAVLVRGIPDRDPAAPPQFEGVPAVVGTGAGAGILPEMAAAEAEYEKATASLLEALRGSDDLPAGALDTIERNLRVIDRAIADSRAALRRDPYNARLGQMVAEACQRKLDVLRDVARLTARV